jgi:hypothetical protein
MSLRLKEIKTETRLSHLGKVKGKKKALLEEKNRLLELVRKTQQKYLIKGEMESRIYYNMLRSYTKRLGEVEEELSFIES